MTEESPKHRWREKDLDNALLEELASDSPSEERIRQLVVQGADVNSVKDDESLLMDAMLFVQDGLDERFLRLLVELGADVNYIADDACDTPLWTACLVGSPTLVEYLLQQGSDPNVVSDYDHTILEWVEIDLGYHDIESGGDPGSEDGQRCKNLEQIIEILRRYGAMRLSEYRARNVSRWLQIFGANDTGLITSGGYIEIDAIDGLTEPFRADFKAWKTAFWDSWPDKDWAAMPPGFDRAAHNAWGRRLAKELRAALPQEITIQYLSLSAEYEQQRIRNVDHETIG